MTWGARERSTGGQEECSSNCSPWRVRNQSRVQSGTCRCRLNVPQLCGVSELGREKDRKRSDIRVQARDGSTLGNPDIDRNQAVESFRRRVVLSGPAIATAQQPNLIRLSVLWRTRVPGLASSGYQQIASRLSNTLLFQNRKLQQNMLEQKAISPSSCNTQFLETSPKTNEVTDRPTNSWLLTISCDYQSAVRESSDLLT